MGRGFTATEEVRRALARIGRTEDLRFSPDGRGLALAGLTANRLLVLDVEAGAPIALTGFLEIESDALRSPHGIAWLDERKLAVASRQGELAFFELPDQRPLSGRARLEPLLSLGAGAGDLVTTPGSVSALPLGLDLVELIVCNNFVHHVSRHLLDRRAGDAVVASDLLLGEGLEVPDGVAHSPGGSWIAISNHDRHAVFLYRNRAGLDRSRPPDGVLGGLLYPHGLRFAAGGTALLVADAGAPFVQLFRSSDGDWSGDRRPEAAIRVLDDRTFERGRHNPQEGGPKGIDLTVDGRLLAVTCERQPLAFFGLDGLMAGPAAAGGGGEPNELMRAALLRYLVPVQARVADAAEAIRRSSEREIALMANSRSWRLTAPLRRLKALANRVRPRAWRGLLR